MRARRCATRPRVPPFTDYRLLYRVHTPPRRPPLCSSPRSVVGYCLLSRLLFDFGSFRLCLPPCAFRLFAVGYLLEDTDPSLVSSRHYLHLPGLQCWAKTLRYLQRYDTRSVPVFCGCICMYGPMESVPNAHTRPPLPLPLTCAFGWRVWFACSTGAWLLMATWHGGTDVKSGLTNIGRS